VDRRTYFLTFTTYGTWLTGDERGSVERRWTPSETMPVQPDQRRLSRARDRVTSEPLTFNEPMRATVADSIVRVCDFKGWILHGVNVRTNHVHVVLGAYEAPESVMNALKAWATRDLRGAGLVSADRKVWTRHGSTRYVGDPRDFERILEYVIEGQGQDLGGMRYGRGVVEDWPP
jgi:REP element-mobilizing transposase RayT